MGFAGVSALTEFWAKCKAAFAAIAHTHSTNDITSGTLSEARGGTGNSSFGAALDGLCYNRAANTYGDYGAMWLDDSDDKVHVGGPLPIEYGGTGASTAAQARTNLGITSGGGSTTTWYGTCGTTASTAAKVVTCADFALVKGAIIAILFTTANTASTPTLNVNSTGAKSIYIGSGTVNSTTNTLKWSANTLLYFMYDGTYFRYLGARASAAVVPPDGAGVWYGTSSTAAGTAAKASTIANFRLMKGAIVSVTFSTENTVYGALTLNINSTGAKTIYVNNAATSATNKLVWNAGETLTFIYSGSYWYVISRYLLDSDFVKLIDKNIVLPNTNINIADAYNQDTYGGYGSVIFADVYNNQIGYIQTIQIAEPNDGMSSKIAIQIGGNNHDEDDYNTLALGFDANDNPWTTLAYPAAFRKALNLGEQPTPPDTTGTNNVPKQQNTNITSIRPGAGVWLISGRARFAASTAGIRVLKLSTTPNDTDTPHATTSVPFGAVLYLSVLGCFELSANDTVYLIAYHDNGSALNVSMGQIEATRIG